MCISGRRDNSTADGRRGRRMHNERLHLFEGAPAPTELLCLTFLHPAAVLRELLYDPSHFLPIVLGTKNVLATQLDTLAAHGSQCCVVLDRLQDTPGAACKLELLLMLPELFPAMEQFHMVVN